MKENKSVKKDFLQIRDGKIIQLVPEKTETSKTFETKTGRKFEAEVYTNLVSNVKYLQVFEDEFDGITYKKLSVTMCDQENNFECLTMSFNSNVAASLLSRLYNPEFQPLQEVNLGVFKGKDGFDVLFIKQNGLTIKSAFNKENPLPKWIETKVNKKIVWDKSEYLDALESLVDLINKRLKFEPETMTAINPMTRTNESLLLVDDNQDDMF
jgi:predicted HTH transcriptional regulator